MKLIMAFCFLLLLYGFFSMKPPRRRGSGSSRHEDVGGSESTTELKSFTEVTIDGIQKPWRPTEQPSLRNDNQHNRQQ